MPLVPEIAPCLLIFDGAMLARSGSHSTGVDLIVPVIKRRQLFNAMSTFLTCVLCDQTGKQYSAVE